MPAPLLVAGAGAVLSGIGGAIFGKRNVRKQYQADKALSKYQFELNQQAWREQNAYNHPSEQMSRLRAAGLNPNLVYGKGTVGNTTSNTPEYQAIKTDMHLKNPFQTGIVNMLNSYQDIRLKDQQVNNMKAQEEAIRVKTKNDDLAQMGIWAKSGIAQNKLMYMNRQGVGYKLYKTQLSLMQERARQIQLDNELRMRGINPQDNVLLRILGREYNKGTFNSLFKYQK